MQLDGAEDDDGTLSQDEAYEEFKEVRTKAGRPLNETKLRGELFERETEQSLLLSGNYSKVINSNLIVNNSAGVDHLAFTEEGMVELFQSKAFQSDGQIFGTMDKQTSELKFARELASKTYAGQITAKAFAWHNYLERKIKSGRIKDPNFIKAVRMLKARKRGDTIEADDDEVKLLRRRLRFAVTPDTVVPKRHRKRVYRTRHNRSWLGRVEKRIPRIRVNRASNKQKRHDDAEWKG